MSLGGVFRKSVTLMIDRRMSPQEAGQRVATYARENLAEMIRAGASPVYTRFVDGQRGRPEEDVRLNGGSIAYLFSTLAQAAEFALTYAVARSPAKSGNFKASWVIGVNGVPWTGPLSRIRPGAEVVLFNLTPYNRKIDVGGMITSVPPGIVEDTRQAVMRRFPGLTVSRTFVIPPNGRDLRGGTVPYVLKGHAYRSGASYSRKTKLWTRLHAPKRTNRADAKAGQVLTYPAVVISERGS